MNGRVKMTVGEELKVKQVFDYVGEYLVGRFFRISIAEDSIQDWVEFSWEGLLGYNLKFHFFVKKY